MADKFISEVTGEDQSSGIDFENGPGPSEIAYQVFNAENMEDAITFALSRIGIEIPAVFMGLPCLGFNDCRGDDADTYIFRANYRGPTVGGGGGAVPTVSFTTTGGTARVFKSRRNSGAFGRAGEPAPDFGGLINVTKDGVEGADTDVGIFDFTVNLPMDPADLTDAFVQKLGDYTDCVNSEIIFGKPKYTVRFLGATGQETTSEAGINFTFRYSKNIPTDELRGIFPTIVFGDGATKYGHDLLWVLYDDTVDTDAKYATKRVRAVYFEEMFPAIDLRSLGFS